MVKLLRDEKYYIRQYIVEIVIWKVGKEEYKYSLVLIKDGERLVGIDNHEDKEPHVHYRGEEKPYEFQSVKKLVHDFWELASQVMEDEG